GYQVANKVTVTVSDFSKIPAIIDAAVKAGANTSNSVLFDIKDRKTYDDKVLAAAMANARHRATVMAAAEDAKIGRVIAISDIFSFNYTKGRVAAYIMPEYASDDTPILPGEISIDTQVTVTYAIE
ncbi:MAG: SIMPL domain-containing protein, partial [Rhizomicrobium sp.]